MKLLKESILRNLGENVLVEESFSTLATLSDPERMARSKDIVVKYQGLYQSSTKHAVTKWKAESSSKNGKEYDTEVSIEVDGGLFAIAKGKWDAKKFATTMSKADVKVYCSCPDFYWSGAKYNLGPNGLAGRTHLPGNHTIAKSAGYKYEKDIVTHAPDIRDPKREHVLCKHLGGVFRRFASNAFDIMRDARRFVVDVESVPEKEITATMASSEPMKKLKTGLLENFVSEVETLHVEKKLPDEPLSQDEINEITNNNQEIDTSESSDNMDEIINIKDDVDEDDAIDYDISEIIHSNEPETDTDDMTISSDRDIESDEIDYNPNDVMKK